MQRETALLRCFKQLLQWETPFVTLFHATLQRENNIFCKIAMGNDIFSPSKTAVVMIVAAAVTRLIIMSISMILCVCVCFEVS